MATIENVEPATAELVSAVLARPDAADALDYILSIPVGGPSCGCGADHWSCDFGYEDSTDLPCTQCGAETWIDSDGTSHHWGDTVDDIDHAADADHVALPERED